MIRVLFLAVLSVLWTHAAFAKCEPGETVINLVHSGEAGPRARFANVFATAANGELQGKACVNVLADKEPFADAAVQAALSEGAAQMAAPAFSEVAKVASPFAVFGLPFAFRDRLALDAFEATAPYAAIIASISTSNSVPLGHVQGTFYQLAAKRAVVEPADAAGLRFRRRPPPDISARPVLIAATAQTTRDESFAQAIASGRIEALTADWATLARATVSDILPNFTQTNHHYDGYLLIASDDWWSKLDAPLRRSLSELAARVVRETNAETARRESALMAGLIRRRKQVFALTERQRNAWLQAFSDMWADEGVTPDIVATLQRVNALP